MRASRRKRSTRTGSLENSAGRTFTAALRPSFESMARYTSPMPPLPMDDPISYEPRRVPADKGMGVKIDSNPGRGMEGIGEGRERRVKKNQPRDQSAPFPDSEED